MNLIESIKNKPMEYFLGLLVIYLLYRDSYNKKNIENMSDVADFEEFEIKELYESDVKIIKNLAKFSNKLQKNNFKVKGNLTVDGDIIAKKNVTVKNLNTKDKFNMLPSGTILAFSKPVSKIPNGWALCDGQNGTPDLRGRMILASGQGASLTNRPLESKGGVETVTITNDTLPSHKHPFYFGNKSYKFTDGVLSPFGHQDGHAYSKCREGDEKWRGRKYVNKDTNEVGEGQPHDNMAPFYTLNFIIKL